MSGEKEGNNWNGYTGFEGGENSVSVKPTRDTADVEDVGMNCCITIIRKDRLSTDQPMLLEGVTNSLIISTKLQYFYVRNHSLGRKHYTQTSNGQELLYYNCISNEVLLVRQRVLQKQKAAGLSNEILLISLSKKGSDFM